MPLFPRLPGALPRLATPPVFPSMLQSWGQSGKGQMRAVGNAGRLWTETFPLLDLANPNVRAFIQALNQSAREGIVWDVQHPYWHKNYGDRTGTPLVNGAGQAGSTLLIDGATKQLIASPEDIGGATWGTVGTPIITTGQPDPFGGTKAVTLQDTESGVQSARTFTGINFASVGSKAVSIFVKQGTAVSPVVLFYNSTAGISIYGVQITWTNGIPVVSNYATAVGTIYAAQNFGGGWWRITFASPITDAAATYRLYVYPAGPVNANLGSTTFFGAQAFDQATPMTDYYWLRQGDLLQVAGCSVVFDVAAGCQPDNTGKVSVPISPPIFVGREPADNAIVTVDPTQIYFKAVITAIQEPPAMDVTRFIDAGLQITWREQPQ